MTRRFSQDDLERLALVGLGEDVISLPANATPDTASVYDKVNAYLSVVDRDFGLYAHRDANLYHVLPPTLHNSATYNAQLDRLNCPTGTNALLRVPTEYSEYVAGSTPMFVGMRFRTSNSLQQHAIFSMGKTDGSGDYFVLRIDNVGRLYQSYKSGSSTGDSVVSQPILQSNTWYGLGVYIANGQVQVWWNSLRLTDNTSIPNITRLNTFVYEFGGSSRLSTNTPAVRDIQQCYIGVAKAGVTFSTAEREAIMEAITPATLYHPQDVNLASSRYAKANYEFVGGYVGVHRLTGEDIVQGSAARDLNLQTPRQGNPGTYSGGINATSIVYGRAVETKGVDNATSPTTLVYGRVEEET